MEASMFVFVHPLAEFQSMVEGNGFPTRFHPSFKMFPDDVKVTGNGIAETFPAFTGPRTSHKVELNRSPRTYAAYPFPGANVSVLDVDGKFTYPSFKSAVPLPLISTVIDSSYANMD